jgi:hypothetical protein
MFSGLGSSGPDFRNFNIHGAVFFRHRRWQRHPAQACASMTGTPTGTALPKLGDRVFVSG